MDYLDFSRSPFGRRRILLISAVLVVGVISFAVSGNAQETETSHVSLDAPKSPSMAEHGGTPISLRGLAQEAEQNNPQIQAARAGWTAAQQVPTQVSTLPDPQFQIQQFSVGSPRPFAGYTNSNFAYVGFGVSQDFPYPGKLRLKGDIAKKDAEVSQQQYEAVRRSVLADVKAAYFQLAYLSKTLGIIESDGQLLQQVEKAADARYRSGMGNQQDLLRTQLEQTKLLREITMHHLEVAKLQAQLKELLNRSQASPDIEPTDLSETQLPYSYEELWAATKAQNPQIAGAEKMVERQKLQVDSAHKDFYPDFNLQYMWQRTDPTQFRAYYMLSFGVRVPIYRSRKQRPELAQAEAELSRSRSEVEVQSQQVSARGSGGSAWSEPPQSIRYNAVLSSPQVEAWLRANIPKQSVHSITRIHTCARKRAGGCLTGEISHRNGLNTVLDSKEDMADAYTTGET